VAVTLKTPWPPAWPCLPLSLHPPSWRCWSWCSTCCYRWNPFWRFLWTSRGTSCPLLQSYPSRDRTTPLPVPFVCYPGVLARSGQAPVRWRGVCSKADQELGTSPPFPFSRLPREAVRKVRNAPTVGFRGPPKRAFSGPSRPGIRSCSCSIPSSNHFSDGLRGDLLGNAVAPKTRKEPGLFDPDPMVK
jgi:hypothetical protein